jgi:S1-C subfamily serine protease
MKRKHSLMLLLVVCTGFVLAKGTSLACAAPTAAGIIEKSPGNSAWHISGQGSTAILTEAKQDTAILEVKRERLKQGSIRLSVETDAKTCAISSGTVELPITVKTEALVEIELQVNDENPVLMIDKKESARSRGKWVDICVKQKDPIIRFKFTAATYATVKVIEAKGEEQQVARAAPADGDEGAAGGPSKPAPRPAKPAPTSKIFDQNDIQDANPVPPTAQAAGGRSLDRAKRCVFHVQIKDAKGEKIVSGSGFLAAPDGLGFTNYHVVRRADSAVATFADGGPQHPVEVWAVRPELDLALVRIKAPPADLRSRGVLKPATIPVEGQEVYALGFPLGLGYSVTRGVVNAIRAASDLPAELRNAHPGVNSWIQTDCTINPGNSGGPLIDASGGLVGINTWLLAQARNVFFAIAASETETVLSSVPAGPMDFATVRAAGGEQKDDWQAFATRLPRVEMKATGTPDQLRAATTAFTTGLVRNCSACGGDGATRVRVTVKQPNSNTPISGIEQRKCQVCNGKGKIEASQEAAIKMAGRFCEALGSLKVKDPKAGAALDHAYQMLTRNLLDSPVAAGVLNDHAMAQFAQRSLKIREPMLVVADYVAGGMVSGEKERVHCLRMYGSDQFLLLTGPRLADEVIAGPVFVGGLVSGEIKTPEGYRAVVIQGGFILKARQRYQDRKKEE